MNTSLFSDIGSADESGFGKCGDNVYWKTVGDTLYIGGNGDMWDFDPFSETQSTICSYNMEDFSKVVILDGVTSIGEYAFSERAFRDITISKTVKTVKSCAFFNCAIHGTLELTDSLHTVKEWSIASDPCRIGRLCVSVNIPVLEPSAFYTRLGAPKEIVLTGDLPDDITYLVKTELFEFPQHTRISYPARWDEKESFYERIVRLLRANVLTCEGIPFEHNEKYFLDLKKALIPTV